MLENGHKNGSYMSLSTGKERFVGVVDKKRKKNSG